MLDLHMRHQNVGGHHRSRDVRHAAGHYREQLGFSQAFKKRTDRQRSFGLSHEDAGGDVGGFGAACSHYLLHNDRHAAYKHPHHAEVIEDREQAGDKYDKRQNLKREDDAERASLRAEIAEDELAAGLGVTKERVDPAANCVKDSTERRFEHRDRKAELQADSPPYDAGLNRLPPG